MKAPYQLMLTAFALSFSSQTASAKSSDIFRCEGLMEYQYEHIGAAYNELWQRGRPVTFTFAKQDKKIQFIDSWYTLEGEMMRTPTLGGNIHAIGFSRMMVDGKNIQTDALTSFFMGFGGSYTMTRKGVSGIVTSQGKCRPLK